MKLIYKNKVIADKCKVCDSIFSELKGLMFSRKLKEKEALIIPIANKVLNSGIHTFFVFYPIDVIWLDSNFKVVDVRKNIRPFTYQIKPTEKTSYIIEFCNLKENIKINDTIKFKNR